MTLHIQPPPNFQGLLLDKPIEVYTRSLPHWRQAGATYFVTFHLADALPSAKQNELESLRRELAAHSSVARKQSLVEEYAKRIFQLTESTIDAGFGNCWFKREVYANELSRAILHFHGDRYEIGCFVIMANHCHLAIRPFAGFDLEQLIGDIKKVTARFVNNREHRSGALWQQESYDRIIRDTEHLYRVVEYIGNNPRKAGIPESEWNRWINPKWRGLGLDFRTL